MYILFNSFKLFLFKVKHVNYGVYGVCTWSSFNFRLNDKLINTNKKKETYVFNICYIICLCIFKDTMD